MLHAYCVRRADEPPPPGGLTGVDGAPVRALRAAELVLWVSVGDAHAGPTVERLRAHDRVVRSALLTATPLPIRFGARFRDEAAAREVLLERAEEFRAALERVAGRVEMGVRVEWGAERPAEPEPHSTAAVRSGREYLEVRRRQLAARSARCEQASLALDRVAEFFADLELPTVRGVLPETHVAGTLAHLVHRTDLGRYRERARAAGQQLDRLALSLSGPWAPYSFV